MKTLLISFFLLVSFTTYSQIPDAALHKKDYVIVSARVTISENKIIYVEKGLRLSPIITMETGKDYMLYDARYGSNDKSQFVNPGEVLNYMAQFGWTLLTVTNLPSTEVNPKEYTTFLYFVRDHIEKK